VTSFSYAVLWRGPEERVYAGKLEFHRASLRLEGVDPEGRVAIADTPYDELRGVQVTRRREDRLQGRPALVIERRDGSQLSIASVDSPGAMNELVDRLALLTTRKKVGLERVAVILPLRKKMHGAARTLLEQGPPFQPETTGLERHYAFVSDDEVVLVFESRAGGETISQLLGDPAVWKAAAAWSKCLAGPPRLAEDAYVWTRDQDGDLP